MHALSLLTSIDKSSPWWLAYVCVRWNDSNYRTLMKHRRYFTRLNRHQVATDAIYDGLEHNETIEHTNSSIEN